MRMISPAIVKSFSTDAAIPRIRIPPGWAIRSGVGKETEIEFTIDDPGAYAKPWTIKRVADLDSDDEVGEYVCENNKDPEHMVGK